MGIPQLWPKAFPTTSYTPFCILYLSHFSFSSPLFWVFPPKAVDGFVIVPCHEKCSLNVCHKNEQQRTWRHFIQMFSQISDWLSSLVWVWVSSHNINSSSLRVRKWIKIVLLFFKDFFFHEDLLQYCFCFMLLDLGSQGLWDLRSPTRGQTCIPCFGR